MKSTVREVTRTIARCGYWLIQRLPLFGGLTAASFKAFCEAFKEMMFVWTLSLSPVILSSFIDAARSGDESGPIMGFWNALWENLKSGEIFIYANALLAPIGFILYKHNRDNARYPNHISFVWVLLITIPLSAVIFALQRAGIITNPRL